jgi:hypothetical protein
MPTMTKTTTKILAFHGEPSLKSAVMDRLREHRDSWGSIRLFGGISRRDARFVIPGSSRS